jgi:hypothetical protein
MGLHPENDIEDYWSLQELMPDHNKVKIYFSYNRWQDIWSNFHISPPAIPKNTLLDKQESEFEKVSRWRVSLACT